MIPLDEEKRAEFIKNLQNERRCVFVVEKSNPRISFGRIHREEPVLMHSRYIVSHGEKRFRWQFEDQDGLDYRGTVRWETAVFMGEYSPDVQESFRYWINIPKQSNISYMMRYVQLLREAKIGPVFMRSPHIRGGKFEMTSAQSRGNKSCDMIAFPDEVSAILGAGFCDPSVRY